MGAAQIYFQDSADRPADANNLSYEVYEVGHEDVVVGRDLYTSNSVELLPPGTYVVLAHYFSAHPITSTVFTIAEGLTTTVDTNLKFGRLVVQALDASGALVDKDHVSITVYQAGNHDKYEGSAVYQNPAVFAVAGGAVYYIEVHVDSRVLSATAVTVSEGVSQTVTVR